MDRRTLLERDQKAVVRGARQRLHGVVLYGSEARGESSPDSDIDVSVPLEGPIDSARDLRANIDALYELVLALERPISAGGHRCVRGGRIPALPCREGGRPSCMTAEYSRREWDRALSEAMPKDSPRLLDT